MVKSLRKKSNWKEVSSNAENEPNNVARVTVKRWLKNNASRFLSPPRIAETRKNSFFLKFKGISPRLVINITTWGMLEVCVLCEKHQRGGKDYWWDILTNFDVSAEQDSSGRYYNSLCLEEYREFYPSRRALLEKEGLELALTWVNKNLRPERWICLCDDGGCRWAKLIEVDELTTYRQKESFYAAFPVGVLMRPLQG